MLGAGVLLLAACCAAGLATGSGGLLTAEEATSISGARWQLVDAAPGSSHGYREEQLWRMEVAAHTASLVIRSMYCQLEPGRPCDLPEASHVSTMQEWASKDAGWERILSSLTMYELARRFWQQQDCERALSAVEQSIALKLFPYTDTALLGRWQQSLVQPGGPLKRPKLELADSLILKANALFELGRRESSVEYLYQALEAIHLSAALMHSSMDMVPEVLQHLETLAAHIGMTAADILQRMKMGTLHDLMARYGITCKGCRERYEYVQQLVARLALPVEVQSQGGQVQGASSAFMQGAYARQPQETTPEYMQRLFAQLVAMVQAQYWQDLGLPCTLHDPRTSQCASYLPAWVYRDQGWASELLDVRQEQPEAAGAEGDSTWQAAAVDMAFTMPPETVQHVGDHVLPGFMQAASLLAARPRRGSGSLWASGRQAGAAAADGSGCSAAWQQVPAGGPLDELLKAMQEQFMVAPGQGAPSSSSQQLQVGYSQCRQLLLDQLGMSQEGPPPPPGLALWPPPQLGALPALTSAPPPPPAKDTCCPTYRRKKPEPGGPNTTRMSSSAESEGSLGTAAAAPSSDSPAGSQLHKEAQPGQPSSQPEAHSEHPALAHGSASGSGGAGMGAGSSSSSLRQAFDKHLQEHLDYLTQGYQYSQDDPIVVFTLTGVTLAVMLAVSFTKNRKRVSRFLAEHRTLLQLHVHLGWVWGGPSGGPAAAGLLGGQFGGASKAGLLAGTGSTAQQRRALAALLRDAMLGPDLAKLENAIAAAEAVNLEVGLVTKAKQTLAQRRRRGGSTNTATASAQRARASKAARRQQQATLSHGAGGPFLSSSIHGGATLGTDASTRSYSTRDSSTSSVQGYGEEMEEEGEGEERGTTIWGALCNLLGSFSVRSMTSSNPTSPSYSVQSGQEMDGLAAVRCLPGGKAGPEGACQGQDGGGGEGAGGGDTRQASGRTRDASPHGWTPSQPGDPVPSRASSPHASPPRRASPGGFLHEPLLDSAECDQDDGWQQHVSRPRRNRGANKVAAADRTHKTSASGTPSARALRGSAPLVAGGRIPLAGTLTAPSKAQLQSPWAAPPTSQAANTPPSSTGTATTFSAAVSGQPPKSAREVLLSRGVGPQPPTDPAAPPPKHTRSQRSGGWLDWISGSVLMSSSAVSSQPTGAPVPRDAAAIPTAPPPPPPPRAGPVVKHKQKAWGSSHAATASDPHAADASLLQSASPIRTSQAASGTGGRRGHKHAAQQQQQHPGSGSAQAAAGPAAPPAASYDTHQPAALSSLLGTSPTGKSSGLISTLSSWMGYSHPQHAGPACSSPAAGHAAHTATYSSITASTAQSLVGSPLPSSCHDATTYSTDNASSNSSHGSGCYSSRIAALPASLSDALPSALAHAPPPVVPSSRPLNPAAPSFRSLRSLSAQDASPLAGIAAAVGTTSAAASRAAATLPTPSGAPGMHPAVVTSSHAQLLLPPLSSSVVCNNLTGLHHTPAAVAAAAAASQRLRHDPFAEPRASRKTPLLPSLHADALFNHATATAPVLNAASHPAAGLLPSSLTYHPPMPAPDTLSAHHTSSTDSAVSPAVSAGGGGLTPSAGGALLSAPPALQPFSMFAANSVWSPSVVSSGGQDGGWGQLPDVAAAMTASSAAWGGVSSGTGVTCSLGGASHVPGGGVPRISNSPSLEDLHGLGEDLQANDLAQDIMRHVVEC